MDGGLTEIEGRDPLRHRRSRASPLRRLYTTAARVRVAVFVRSEYHHALVGDGDGVPGFRRARSANLDSAPSMACIKLLYGPGIAFPGLARLRDIVDMVGLYNIYTDTEPPRARPGPSRPSSASGGPPAAARCGGVTNPTAEHRDAVGRSKEGPVRRMHCPSRTITWTYQQGLEPSRRARRTTPCSTHPPHPVRGWVHSDCRKMKGPNHGRGLSFRASASLALL